MNAIESPTQLAAVGGKERHVKRWNTIATEGSDLLSRLPATTLLLL